MQENGDFPSIPRLFLNRRRRNRASECMCVCVHVHVYVCVCVCVCVCTHAHMYMSIQSSIQHTTETYSVYGGLIFTYAHIFAQMYKHTPPTHHPHTTHTHTHTHSGELRRRARRNRFTSTFYSGSASSALPTSGVVYFSNVTQLRAALKEMHEFRLVSNLSRVTGFGQTQSVSYLRWGVGRWRGEAWFLGGGVVLYLRCGDGRGVGRREEEWFNPNILASITSKWIKSVLHALLMMAYPPHFVSFVKEGEKECTPPH